MSYFIEFLNSNDIKSRLGDIRLIKQEDQKIISMDSSKNCKIE